jgi:hypothetical protein
MDYRIVIAITKGDVGAVNILRDTLRVSKRLGLNHLLLALGPTTPQTLEPPQGSRILWATFTDSSKSPNGSRLTIIPPDQLTDISLGFDRLSKTRTGRVPLLIGDFLDNVLSVSTAPAGLYAFLCRLFTRIRANNQTAFFLATEDMHDLKKTAVLKRFADVVIEYQSLRDDSSQRLEARILDHAENHYSVWDSSENPNMAFEAHSFSEGRFPKFGRHQIPLIQETITGTH